MYNGKQSFCMIIICVFFYYTFFGFDFNSFIFILLWRKIFRLFNILIFKNQQLELNDAEKLLNLTNIMLQFYFYDDCTSYHWVLVRFQLYGFFLLYLFISDSLKTYKPALYRIYLHTHTKKVTGSSKSGKIWGAQNEISEYNTTISHIMTSAFARNGRMFRHVKGCV